MADYRVFFDFGSTFTKAAAFDLETETLAARVQTPSTVGDDITIGLRRAVDLLRERIPLSDTGIKSAVACSSAAGGLRVAAAGLVPDYTTAAAKTAALGAGAKVVGTFSYELSRAELAELESLAPDIVLLAGGTDGGNKSVILHNAGLLAQSAVPVVIAAGNKSARDEIADIFDRAGKAVTFAANVMPELGKIETEQVNAAIRGLFLSRITEAKGISKVSGIISGVRMPTPAAVLEAAKLLSGGTANEPGLGELLLIDAGGATTDVYSVASGTPTRGAARVQGVPEPYAKRTVEGDLGLYHNIDTLAALAGVSADAAENLRVTLSVPDDASADVHARLTGTAVAAAAARHAGRVEALATGAGDVLVQHGKDLSDVRVIIGSGGPVAYSPRAREILGRAAFSPLEADSLRPKNAEYLCDREYILFAVGLLAQSEPDAALRIAKKYLAVVG
ncbi:MAG: glutamate mutase L [Oscillospiraceae bacterium]|jgi:uncharacterized protein (TIGR01319 family)|nr:glutamate mutase L [Oscillospiraceae bacterium]